MDKLAFRQGVYYEGDTQDLRAIYPTPVVSRVSCSFIEAHGPTEIVFREDSFDPVTRIRRGRIFVGRKQLEQWSAIRVDPGPYNPYHIRAYGHGSWQPESTYDAWQPGSSSGRVEGHEVRLGVSDFQTAWRIVGAERISIGHILLTLRGISLIGVVPELADGIINIDGDEASAGPVQENLNALVDALHKQQAQPIVEVAREAAKVILTEWIGEKARGKDLADVLKTVDDKQQLAKCAATVINRLHSRGKSAAREHHASHGNELRIVTDEDAELGVHLIGFLLREIGWAAQRLASDVPRFE